jgi:hypothetical protein
VFSCRQEVNFQGVCLNGTHPYLLAGFRPFLTFLVKVDVRSDYGQWAESTKPRELSRGGQRAKNRLKMRTETLFAIARTLISGGPKLFPLWADSANISSQVNRKRQLSGVK